MNTPQHDLSSMQVLLRLLLFLEFNLFITTPHRQVRQQVRQRIHRQVRQFVRHLQLDKPIPHPGDMSIVSEFLRHKVEFGP